MYIQPDLSSTRLRPPDINISSVPSFRTPSSLVVVAHSPLDQVDWTMRRSENLHDCLLVISLANPLSIGKDCPNCGYLVMICCKLAILCLEEIEMKSRMCSKKGNDINMPPSTALSSSIHLEEAPLRFSDPVCACISIKLWWATTPATWVLGQSPLLVPLVGWFVKIIPILLRTDTE